MSRGTTRRIAFGRRTRTLPNSSRSVTTASPSGPPSKPPLRLRSTSAMAPGGGASAIRDTMPTAWPASPRSSASRGAWSDTRTTRAFSPSQCSTPSTSRSVRPGGRTGSRQPNRSPEVRLFDAYAMPCGLDGIGLPGELERARAVEATSSSRAAAGTPWASRAAGRPGRRAPRAARRPGATGTRRHRRGRPARRGRAACPGRGGRGPVDGATRRAQTSAASPAASARPAVTAGGRSGVRRLPGEPGEVEREPLREAVRPAAEAGPDLVAPPGGSRNSVAGRSVSVLTVSTERWSVGSKAREAVDLVAEELDPDRERRRTAGTRRRCRRGARTRPGPRPRGRARSRARTARRGARPCRSASRTSASGARAGRSSGPRVAWSSAWTLATRTLAAPPRHAASAATRAAVSSGTSSLRSYASDVRGSSTATSEGSPSHAPSSSATRSPISASRATQQIRSPSAASASAAARYDFAPCGTDVSPTCWPCIPGASRAAPRRSRSEANEPVSWSSRGSAARSGTRRPASARRRRRAGFAATGRDGRLRGARRRRGRGRAAGSSSSTSASADAARGRSPARWTSAAARRSAHSRATFSATFRWRVVRPR